MGNEASSRVYLYGLNREYQLVRFIYIPAAEVTIMGLLAGAEGLRSRYLDLRYVYAVDNSYAIFDAFRELTHDDSVENRAVFKVMLEQYGMPIPIGGGRTQ